MGSRRSIVSLALSLCLLVLTACGSTARNQTSPSALGDNAITVASFDFGESTLLAELYSQALEAGGFQVKRAFNLGPREFVTPALARGLVELVPEYAGTALQFLSLGADRSGVDVALTHAVLDRALRDTSLRPLAAAPAQNSNEFVVTRTTAIRYGLRTLSDAAKVGNQLTFGGPPECSTRQLCLVGLQRVYGLKFRDVIALDVGGPLTLQALQSGGIDVALLFSTDPTITDDHFVVLQDDRGLQGAENITPIVRAEVLARWPKVAGLIDAVSHRLTTDALRELNAELATGTSNAAAIAAAWLKGTSG